MDNFLKTGFVIILLAVLGCGVEYSSTVTVSTNKTAESAPSSANDDDSSEKAKPSETNKTDKLEAKNSKGDWPLFRGNQKSQGVASSLLPKKLDVLWKHKVKNGAFEGTPIIIGKDKKIAFVGDADGSLFAFDMANGDVEWEFKSEIGYVSAPAFRDNKIYIGDLDGKFYCIDATKGEKLWEYESQDSIDSSANFHKDLVLFGSRDACLYALNAKTGDLDWKLETADQVRCSITVVDGRAFVAGCDGALHIVDLDKGKEIDSVVIESPTGVTPAAMGDYIFVGTEQSGFFSINWKKAEQKWIFNDNEGSISTRCSPAVNEDHVVFGARNRKLYSVNPITGKENWSTELKANIDSSPVIVGDRVFVGSTEGRFYELDLDSGKIVWQKQFDGGFIGSPAVGYGCLVIATDRGVVYCLGNKG